MTAGQASVEYAGLLGLAAVLGAALALTAGPPLAGAVRDAFASALSRDAPAQERAIAGAADIADVQSALLGGEDAPTPDAALVALRRRHAAAHADEVASAVLLGAALATTPWLGARRAYRAWSSPDDGPYESLIAANGDRDVEQPTGGPVAMWVTVAAQRRAVAKRPRAPPERRRPRTRRHRADPERQPRAAGRQIERALIRGARSHERARRDRQGAHDDRCHRGRRVRRRRSATRACGRVTSSSPGRFTAPPGAMAGATPLPGSTRTASDPSASSRTTRTSSSCDRALAASP